ALLAIGLVGCGAEPAPAAVEPPQPTVLARYDGAIAYTVEGTTYSSPNVATVFESGGSLVLAFERQLPWGPFAQWTLTDLPPNQFALSPRNSRSTDPCVRTTWTGHGSGEFTLAHARFDISAAVHQDTCMEGPIDSSFSFSFSGAVVR